MSQNYFLQTGMIVRVLVADLRDQIPLWLENNFRFWYYGVTSGPTTILIAGFFLECHCFLLPNMKLLYAWVNIYLSGSQIFDVMYYRQYLDRASGFSTNSLWFQD